jgi:hypothetical protein
LALFLVTGARAGADETPVPTNLALLKSVTEKALTEILDSLDVPSDKPVYIEAAAHHETNWLVAESLAELMRRRGFAPIILEEGAALAATPTPEVPQGGEEEREAGTPDVEPDDDAGVEDETISTQGEVGEGDIFAEDEDDEFGEDEEEPGFDDDDEEEEFGGGEEDPDDEIFGGEDEGSEDSGLEDSDEEGAGDDVGSGRRRSEATGADVAALISQQTAGTPPAPPPATPSRTKVEGEILRFRVVDLGVTYPKSKRALLLLGPKSITRLTGAHLRVTHVTGPEGAVKGVADGEWHNIDRFPGSVRPYVEGANYPFTRPEMKPAPWGRLVEPAVVLGIVSGLVYLFYANQS